MSQVVRVEKSGPIATVVLDRPAVRNAVDPATARALAEAFLALEADPAVRCMVLWGAGGTFCAGADLTEATAGEHVVDPRGIAVPIITCCLQRLADLPEGHEGNHQEIDECSVENNFPTEY